MSAALELARRVLRLEAEAVLALIPRLDARFDAAVDLLFGCRGRVIVTGLGKSGIIARKIAATMASTGTPAHFLHAADGMHGDLGMVARTDVVLALSNSGETDELLGILPAFKRLGVPAIVLTGNPDSSVAHLAEVVLDAGVATEACPLNLAPTASTTAALAMGDALAMALFERRGLGPQDFVTLHPGGALGRRVPLAVRDVMRTGAALPRVAEDAPLAALVEEMSAKSLGMATVVDGDGRLTGVVTDGDLRRLLRTGGGVAARRAGDIASREPKLVGADELAAGAVARMERHAVTSLVVVDAAGRPEGVVHLHDILRARVL